jgi:HEAT repeat protein
MLFIAVLALPGVAAAQSTWSFEWYGRVEHDARGLKSEDPDQREAAVHTLRTYDPALTKAHLVPMLEDPSLEVKVAAARALGVGAVSEAAPRLIA